MNVNDTFEEKGILDDFLVPKIRKGKSYVAFTVSSFTYIFVVLGDFLFDIETLSVRSFEWQVAAIIMVLPVLGMIFHLAGKRAGWIINTFYYVVFTLLCCYGLLQPTTERERRLGATINWRLYLFFALSLTCTVLVFSGGVRKYFRIGNVLLIAILLLSIACALVLGFLLLEK